MGSAPGMGDSRASGAFISPYHAYKWIWPATLGPDAAVNASLEFYRSELEKRRDYNSHVWRRSGVTFCFLGLAMVIVPALIDSRGTPLRLLNALPVFVLLVIWVIAFFFMKKRNRRTLKRRLTSYAHSRVRTVHGSAADGCEFRDAPLLCRF